MKRSPRKNNYRNVDYSTLKINVQEYSRIKTAVINANGQKKKIKVSYHLDRQAPQAEPDDGRST